MDKKRKPRIAYGFWRYARSEMDAAMRMIETARAMGVAHFDTADVYGGGEFGGAEALLGDIRKRAPSLLTGIEIATKAGVEGARPFTLHTPLIDMTKAEIIQTGTRLGLDYGMTSSCYDPDPLGKPQRTHIAVEFPASPGVEASREGRCGWVDLEARL